MPRVERTPQAHEDAVAIWEYIAQDNPVAASKLIVSIKERTQRLATMPESAEAVPMIGRLIRQAPLRELRSLFSISGLSAAHR